MDVGALEDWTLPAGGPRVDPIHDITLMLFGPAAANVQPQRDAPTS